MMCKKEELTPVLQRLKLDIEEHLISIEKLFNTTPRITIVIRTMLPVDSDIMLTSDADLEAVINVIHVKGLVKPRSSNGNSNKKRGRE